MSNLNTAGIGGSLGSTLALVKPLIMSDRVWYVSSTTGNTAYSGKDRKSPKATIAQAITAIGADDDHVIVCLDQHAETVSTSITLSRRVTIVGEGLNGGKPGVLLTLSGANDMFVVTAARCEIQGIYFKPPSGAASASYVSGAVADVWLRDCYFDFNQYNDGPGVELQSGANDWMVQNCVFTSTETAVATKPDSAMRTTAAITGLRLEGVVFDGGTVGFETSAADPWAFDGSAAAISGIRVVNMSLIRGADMKLHASTTGYVNPQTVSGNANLEWT